MSRYTRPDNTPAWISHQRLHPLDFANQRNNPAALTRKHISLRRLARAAYYALVAHAAIWCAVQGYLTVSYVQERAAFVGGW